MTLPTVETVPDFEPDWQAALTAARSCPRYQSTPLYRREVDGVTLAIKDERLRFGLGSFKALGGVYAVLDHARRQLGSRQQRGSVDDALKSIESLFEAREGADTAPGEAADTAPGAVSSTESSTRSTHHRLVFVCASAGNHGLAVAAGARLIGATARIHLSSEVPESFAERLRGRGAEVVRSGVTYEASLEAALEDASQSGACLLADTAWDGYVSVPTCIMAGYTVIAEELREAFDADEHWPTDVYLQAGVGGLAGALTWMIRRRWSRQPRIVIVEPDAAPCLAASARGGSVATVEGPVSTMGRLDCKTASPLAVRALADADVEYLAISDAQAEAGAQALARLELDTTPSGAAGFAAWQLDQAAQLTRGASPLVILSEEGL